MTPSRGLTVSEQPDGSSIIVHRYVGNWGTVLFLSLFVVGWSFFCYLVTGHIIFGFRHPEQLGLFFAIVAIPFVLLMYFGDIICIYYWFWSLWGKTSFHNEVDALQIRYLHPWHTREVKVVRTDIKLFKQLAHRNENSTRIHQRDLCLLTKTRSWPYTLLWNERQEAIERLGALLATWAEVEFATEIVVSSSGT